MMLLDLFRRHAHSFAFYTAVWLVLAGMASQTAFAQTATHPGAEDQPQVIYQQILVPGPERIIYRDVPGRTRTIIREVPGPERTVIKEVPGPTRTIIRKVPGPERIVVQEVPGPERIVVKEVPVVTRAPLTKSGLGLNFLILVTLTGAFFWTRLRANSQSLAFAEAQ